MKTINFIIEKKKRVEIDKGSIDRSQKNRDSSVNESLKREKLKYGPKRSQCQKRMPLEPAINSNKDTSLKIKVESARTETMPSLG